MRFHHKKAGAVPENAVILQDTPSEKPARKKLSAKTMIALTVDSLFVLSAAAIGGVSYYKAANNSVTTLLPCKITIGTSAQNEDVQLTLHESLADDYTTAYIFSIKGLTDTGKSLLTNNILGDTCQTAFYPNNTGENTGCRLYQLKKQSLSGESVDSDIGLRCGGAAADAANNAVYVIRPIESLREADCEYYVLYIISEEPQQLSLTFDGLQLTLPEATTRTPGIDIELGGFIQNYSLTLGGSQIASDYPADAVITPLGLYVNGSKDSSFFGHTKFALTDGSEIEFNQAVQGEKDYSPAYCSSDDGKFSVYLFKDIENIPAVKSLVCYDNVEFPVDGGTPFVRSTGRELMSSSNTAILRTIAQRLQNYIAKTCPVSVICPDSSASKETTKSAWSDVKYGGKNSLCFDVVSDKAANRTDRFFVSLTDISGGTLEQEARAEIDTFNEKLHAAGKAETFRFNIIKTGTFLSTELIAADCGETPSGYTRRCIFALYNNQLLTIQFDSYKGGAAYKAFDDLLKLF